MAALSHAVAELHKAAVYDRERAEAERAVHAALRDYRAAWRNVRRLLEPDPPPPPTSAPAPDPGLVPDPAPDPALPRGVSPAGRGRFSARVNLGGIGHSIGTHATPEEARRSVEARVLAVLGPEGLEAWLRSEAMDLTGHARHVLARWWAFRHAGKDPRAVLRGPGAERTLALLRASGLIPPAGAEDAPPVPAAALGAGPRRAARASSGYRGVYRTPTGRYAARLRVASVSHYCGTHDTPEQAARAHDAQARTLLGSEALLNFPEEIS